jgi:hypothetical protein
VPQIKGFKSLFDILAPEKEDQKGMAFVSHILKRYQAEPSLDVSGYQPYFKLLSQRELCQQGICRPNPHFDELYRVFSSVRRDDDNALKKLFRFFFKDRMSDLKSFMTITFDILSIKYNTP